MLLLRICADHTQDAHHICRSSLLHDRLWLDIIDVSFVLHCKLILVVEHLLSLKLTNCHNYVLGFSILDTLA